MDREWISSKSAFEQQAAYSRAVVCDDEIFASATTGFDYAPITINDDVVAQGRQTFDNIKAARQQVDALLQGVVRIPHIPPDPTNFEKCWPVLRERLGNAPPAAPIFGARLVDQSMEIEIEITARKRRKGTPCEPY
jgi:enamine deaminase RidA (YjgF/YER057c/UK114 family)